MTVRRIKAGVVTTLEESDKPILTGMQVFHNWRVPGSIHSLKSYIVNETYRLSEIQ
jgi:hypothetical protein